MTSVWRPNDDSAVKIQNVLVALRSSAGPSDAVAPAFGVELLTGSSAGRMAANQGDSGVVDPLYEGGHAMKRNAFITARLGLVLLSALVLSLSHLRITTAQSPDQAEDPGKVHHTVFQVLPPPVYPPEEYVNEYTYSSTPDGQQLSEAGVEELNSSVSCQVVVSDPTFHTHNVSTVASQLCSGIFIQQSLTVCVQVERWFLFVPYWADLGCKSDAKRRFFLSVETDRYGYDYGTTRYRTRSVGSFIASDGTVYTTPNVVSRSFTFTYEP